MNIDPDKMHETAAELEHPTSDPAAATQKPKTQKEIDEEIAESMREAPTW